MDTTKITSAPTECQFHNNCGGWCESPREADHNLCADCLEAHDDDLTKGNVDSPKAVSEPLPLGLPAEQHHGEPVTLPVCKAKLTMSHDWDQGYSEGWSDYRAELAKLGPLYTRPAQGEPVGYLVQRVDPTGVPRLDRPLMTLCKPEEWGSAFKAQPLYTHADPAEVERLREDLASTVADKDAYARNAIDLRESLTRARKAHGESQGLMQEQIDNLRAQLAEAHALLREVGESGFMVDGQIMPSNEALELQDRVDSALPTSAQPSSAAGRGAWQPLAAPGQIQVGDWVSATVAGSFICARAQLVIEPGTAREEIVYNRKKNHYFVTSMAVDGTSSHKSVLVAKAKP